ncbi:branched-chain amino acid transport system ATP-binding protein [Thermomonospora echinospora]|uniref:Branched-chain amino acid transport system ATP-binding protein n=1 Tax=Thermomonospora echinospora TaxID=1992 RepID=A0A1H6DYP5_9ACTN|nr:ABC transporter ATP-binding protein [Thermomonospora echinospora]SEG90472.1 branched-chain amino acid transport system ATP-binding protein [Thermomonospora echinospora]
MAQVDGRITGGDGTSSAGAAALEVVGVTAGYGAHTVLRDVSLAVGDGEVVTLLGHNGAGKSTLLRAIAGALDVERGDIRFAGVSQLGRGAARIAQDGIALVPQGRGIFPTLSIGENLRLGAGVARNVTDRTRVTLDFVLELFPALADRLHEDAGTLSGGQQQMVAIGTALMASPKFLLLDEPSTGLAPVLVQTMLAQIRSVHRELGIGVLIVEQNIHEALRISDRAYVLRLGEIVREGPASTLLDAPDIWGLF